MIQDEKMVDIEPSGIFMLVGEGHLMKLASEFIVWVRTREGEPDQMLAVDSACVNGNAVQLEVRLIEEEVTHEPSR